jgi:hypothetical protein
MWASKKSVLSQKIVLTLFLTVPRETKLHRFARRKIPLLSITSCKSDRPCDRCIKPARSKKEN